MDYFSKWIQENATVVDVLVEEWICRFKVPFELHSDQLWYSYDKKKREPSHYVRSEMNMTINPHIEKVVSGHQKD